MKHPLSDELVLAIFAAISQFENIKSKAKYINSYWRSQRFNNNHIKIAKTRKWSRCSPK